MADDENSSTSSDESLDIRSDQFDPMKALYSSKIRHTSSIAPIYDNVCKFESTIYNPYRPNVTAGSSADAAKQEEERSSRWNLPRQGTVSRRKQRIDRQNERNVLAKMGKALGPLGVLYDCMERKIRVKVYTRNARGIRGHVEAYVVAFDKHWNLALEDCFEVWTRKSKRKAPALGIPDRIHATDPAVPKVILKKIEGKMETLERHVPQMLLRGEQIAIIVKID